MGAREERGSGDDGWDGRQPLAGPARWILRMRRGAANLLVSRLAGPDRPAPAQAAEEAAAWAENAWREAWRGGQMPHGPYGDRHFQALRRALRDDRRVWDRWLARAETSRRVPDPGLRFGRPDPKNPPAPRRPALALGDGGDPPFLLEGLVPPRWRGSPDRSASGPDLLFWPAGRKTEKNRRNAKGPPRDLLGCWLALALWSASLPDGDPPPSWRVIRHAGGEAAGWDMRAPAPGAARAYLLGLARAATRPWTGEWLPYEWIEDGTLEAWGPGGPADGPRAYGPEDEAAARDALDARRSGQEAAGEAWSGPLARLPSAARLAGLRLPRQPLAAAAARIWPFWLATAPADPE